MGGGLPLGLGAEAPSPRYLLFALLALYALYMLARYAPRALRLAREPGKRPGALVPVVVNVLLAVAILAVAVKGLVGALISR